MYQCLSFVFIFHTQFCLDMVESNTTHVFLFLFFTFVIVNVITSSSTTVIAAVDETDNNTTMTTSEICSVFL